jgi:hypothetical protein
MHLCYVFISLPPSLSSKSIPGRALGIVSRTSCLHWLAIPATAGWRSCRSYQARQVHQSMSMSALCLPAPKQPAGQVSPIVCLFVLFRFLFHPVHTVNYTTWVIIHKAIPECCPFKLKKKIPFAMESEVFFRNRTL